MAPAPRPFASAGDGTAVPQLRAGRARGRALPVRLVGVLLLGAFAAAGAVPARAEAAAPGGGEVRALWVVRTALGSAGQVRTMVEQAAASGFNTLLVQVRGRGDALYASAYEPRAESLPADPAYDPLQVTIEAARRRGLAVHAWVNTHLVWGPAAPPRSPQHLVNAHPEWLAVPRSLGRELYGHDPHAPGYVARLLEYAAANTATVEGLFTSPSHPAVQERVRQVWVDLARNYDLDGIHFDYVRFPSPQFDYSRGALQRFAAWVKPRLPAARYLRLAAAAEQDPYALVEALPEYWNVFRRDSISALVRRVYRAVKELRPELVVSAAVLPDRRRAREQRFQAWTAWLADGILDVAVPMAYTTDPEQFRDWIAGAHDAAGSGARLWAGVGAYKNPVAGTLLQVDHARREGAGGVVVFAYAAAASTAPEPGAPPPLQQIGQAAFAVQE